jgi:hypothetical protein
MCLQLLEVFVLLNSLKFERRLLIPVGNGNQSVCIMYCLNNAEIRPIVHAENFVILLSLLRADAQKY